MLRFDADPRPSTDIVSTIASYNIIVVMEPINNVYGTWNYKALREPILFKIAHTRMITIAGAVLRFDHPQDVLGNGVDESRRPPPQIHKSQCLDCCDAHSNSEMGQNSGNQFSLAYRRLLTLLPQALEYILVKSRAKPKLRSPIRFRLAWSERGHRRRPRRFLQSPTVCEERKRYPPTTLAAGAVRRTCSQFP